MNRVAKFAAKVMMGISKANKVDGNPNILCFGAGCKELGIFLLLRVDDADDGCAKYALVDYLVEPVNYFPAFFEPNPKFFQNKVKGNANYRDSCYNRQCHPPVDGNQQNAGSQNDDDG